MKRKKVNYVMGLLRISLGWIFLWAFIDKVFGLGFATEKDAAWILGGSPTSGFLEFATKGPFVTIYKAMAGSVFVDWLFMIGLLGIGLALILGVAVRLAAYSGVFLMFLMWSAVLPPEHNPFMDDHIIYALILIVIAQVKAGQWIGLGKRWSKISIVKKYKFLE